MNQLKESKNIADGVKKMMQDKKGEDYDSLKKTVKSINKSIKDLTDELLGPESKKQGIVRSPNPTVLSYYFSARRYLGSSLKAPGATEERLLKQGQARLTPWLEKVNTFYSEEWPKFEEQCEATDLSPFKETKSFKLEE